MNTKLVNEIVVIAVGIIAVVGVFTFFCSSCNDSLLELDEEVPAVVTRSVVDTTSSAPTQDTTSTVTPTVTEWTSVDAALRSSNSIFLIRFI